MTSSGHKYKYMSHVTAGPFQASAPTTISSQCPHDHRTPHSHTHFASASSAQSTHNAQKRTRDVAGPLITFYP
eukprot:scaffold3282_cov101-Isochrysis_galbana.AAC.3